MFGLVDDFEAENDSIDSVLQCWEDVLSVDTAFHSAELIHSDDMDLMQPALIPDSPKASIEDPTPTTSNFSPLLQDLIKRYPKFVPASLPSIGKKRSRPICLFVNYMMGRPKAKESGTKRKAEHSGTSTTTYVTSDPTDIPVSRHLNVATPTKRQKVVETAIRKVSIS